MCVSLGTLPHRQSEWCIYGWITEDRRLVQNAYVCRLHMFEIQRVIAQCVRLFLFLYEDVQVCLCVCVCAHFCAYSNSNSVLVWVPVRGRAINHCKSVFTSRLYLKKGQLGRVIHIFCKWKSTFHPSDSTLGGFVLVAERFLNVCSLVLDTLFFQICLSAASKSSERRKD